MNTCHNVINKYYQFVDVTDGGFDFLLKELRYGETLSNLVAKYILIESGKLETFAPQNIELSALLDFRATYNIGQGVSENLLQTLKTESASRAFPEMDFFVAPIVQDFLAQSEQNICILEDIDSSPGDPGLTASGMPPMFTFAEVDVYFYIDRKRSTIDTISKVFSMVSPMWSTRAFLTSLPKELTLSEANQKMEMKDIEAIAQRTQKIIVGVYDGESYLVWHRDLATN